MKQYFIKSPLILTLLISLLPLCACTDTGGSPASEPTVTPAVLEAAEPSAVPEAVPETYTIMGTEYGEDAVSVDLTGIHSADIPAVSETLEHLGGLETVLLGSENGEDPLPWSDIEQLHRAAPHAVIDYSFTLYGRSFNLRDEVMDLKHIKISDEGELVRSVTACMTNLTYLDMDSCEVSNEKMAELRDSLPDAEVIWRIRFGRLYSVRTDTERILASMPGRAGELIHNNVEALKYCTKVKYIDLGHNNYLDTIEFCRYMPELEVAIFGMTAVEDFSPLAECPKLEYLEAMTSRLHDLTPFAGLKNLKHLNICYNFAVNDISPLYSLTQLERLWIGKYDPVPPEQIEKLRELVPDCIVDDTVADPTENGWRFDGADSFGNLQYAERYALLREQFGYTEHDYAFYWNDPLYDYSWHAPEPEPDEVEDFPYVPEL